MKLASPLLKRCYSAARQIEAAADRLGPAWKGYEPTLRACRDFRAACTELAQNRGFTEVTIAFVGRKKSGKSTVASLLVADKDRIRRLKIGQGSADATAKPTWIAAHRPKSFDESTEGFIPCHQNELVSLGFPYALLDVPGANERDAGRQLLADRALDSAIIKVVVIRRHEIESCDVKDYLEGAAGAPIIPVINFIRHDESGSDCDAWERDLRARCPSVLPRVEIRDWRLADGEEPRDQESQQAREEQIQGVARQTLVARLAEAVNGADPTDLVGPQLARKLKVFDREVTRIASTYLPATSAALEQLADELSRIPAQAVDALLGSERLLMANVRIRCRAILLERTPIFLFPWRLSMVIANLVYGATDRLPLALLGSVPSILTTAGAVAKNIKGSLEFAREARSGLQTRVATMIKEAAEPQLRAVDHALRKDLGSTEEALRVAPSSTATLRGIDALQSKSTALLQDLTEKFAPGALSATVLGFVGFTLFWVVFGWPVLGIYQDFLVAAGEVLAGKKSAWALFPAGTGSMLFTSAVLAGLPMGLFLLGVLAYFTRSKTARECSQELRTAHAEKLNRLIGAGTIDVEITEPRIDACRVLLGIGGARVLPEACTTQETSGRGSADRTAGARSLREGREESMVSEKSENKP